MIKFRDIFRHKENLYIHLIKTDDQMYVAKILDEQLTTSLQKEVDEKSKNPKNDIQYDTKYCFVILTTEDFQKQGAHYGVPALNINISFDIVNHLNEEDTELLKKEILQDVAIPDKLRKPFTELYGDESSDEKEDIDE